MRIVVIYFSFAVAVLATPMAHAAGGNARQALLNAARLYEEEDYAGAVESFYWSSSSASGADTAWRVSFNRGDVDSDGVGSAYYVRCVRSEPVNQSSRVVRDTSTMYAAVVTDNATGLVWHGCTAGKRGDNSVGGQQRKP